MRLIERTWRRRGRGRNIEIKNLSGGVKAEADHQVSKSRVSVGRAENGVVQTYVIRSRKHAQAESGFVCVQGAERVPAVAGFDMLIIFTSGH